MGGVGLARGTDYQCRIGPHTVPATFIADSAEGGEGGDGGEAGGGGDSGGEGGKGGGKSGGGGDGEVKQTLKPPLTTEPSDDQLSAEASTPSGPSVPE